MEHTNGTVAPRDADRKAPLGVGHDPQATLPALGSVVRRAAAPFVACLAVALAGPASAPAQERGCRVIDETPLNDSLRVRRLVCVRADTVQDTVAAPPEARPAATPPAAAGRPAASAAAECTVVVTDDQAPQAAIDAAEPGDVICLRGTFGMAYGFGGGQLGRNGQLVVHAKRPGTPEQPITLRNEPGQVARIEGDFDGPTNLYVYVAASHWRVVGLEFEVGGIVVGVVDDVQVLENTIRRPVFPIGNAGGVRTLGNRNVGATNVLIEGNLIEDVYGCNGGLGECPPRSAVPWNQVRDVEHVAGIAKQGCGGTHIFRRNTIRRVPALTYLKHPCPGDRIVIESNSFGAAQWSGQCRTPPTVRNNTYNGVGRAGRGCPRG